MTHMGQILTQLEKLNGTLEEIAYSLEQISEKLGLDGDEHYTVQEVVERGAKALESFNHDFFKSPIHIKKVD